jgi:hypothetical protein
MARVVPTIGGDLESALQGPTLPVGECGEGFGVEGWEELWVPGVSDHAGPLIIGLIIQKRFSVNLQ